MGADLFTVKVTGGEWVDGVRRELEPLDGWEGDGLLSFGEALQLVRASVPDSASVEWFFMEPQTGPGREGVVWRIISRYIEETAEGEPAGVVLVFDLVSSARS